MDTFDKKILEGLGKKLLKKKQTIAVAESVTAGNSDRFDKLVQFGFRIGLVYER